MKNNLKKGDYSYKELIDEELCKDIISSIREGRPLNGKGGALTPLIKKLLEATLDK